MQVPRGCLHYVRGQGPAAVGQHWPRVNVVDSNFSRVRTADRFRSRVASRSRSDAIVRARRDVRLRDFPVVEFTCERRGVNRRTLRVVESARRNRGLAHQAGERDLARAFAPAHQVGDLVHFHQPVHALAQAELIAVFLRAEIRIGTDSESAQGLSAKLAGLHAHFRANYRKSPVNLLV